jgi:hypothetical protein
MVEHNYSEIIERPSDCTNAGRKKYLCVCGDSYTEEIEAHGHDYVKESVIDATEESDGMINYVCSVCGDTTPRIIPAGSMEIGGGDDKKFAGSTSDDEKNETVFVNRLVLSVMLFLVIVLVAVLVIVIIKALVKEIIFIRKRKRT